MSEAQSFTRAIRATPEKQSSWLAFADWLGERRLALERYCRAYAAALQSPHTGPKRELKRQIRERSKDFREVPRDQLAWLAWELREHGLVVSDPTELLGFYAEHCEAHGDPYPALRTLASFVVHNATLLVDFLLPVLDTFMGYVHAEQVSVGELRAAVERISLRVPVAAGQHVPGLRPPASGDLSIARKQFAEVVAAIEYRSPWLYFNGNLSVFQCRGFSYSEAEVASVKEAQTRSISPDTNPFPEPGK